MMKVLDRVIEKKLRDRMQIDSMQFGFSPGKNTTDAIYIVSRCRRSSWE
jgi:hypothetical protein